VKLIKVKVSFEPGQIVAKMIVLVFLATVLFCFGVQFLFQRRKFYKFADNIPSPKSFGLLGHAPYFVGKDEKGSKQFQ
jgi:hypothetical protein